MTNLDDLRKHVSTLTDEALLEVRREDLVEAAQAVYGAELESRGLSWPAAAVDAESEGEAAPVEPGHELVSVGTYESIEEARFARSLLENDGIPVWFAGELEPLKMTGDPRAALELLTQASFLEQAQLVLSTEVSDEELARQAEEAGLEEADEVPAEGEVEEA